MRYESLRWPLGWKRTSERASAHRFNCQDGPVTFERATRMLRDALNKLGASQCVISVDRFSNNPAVAVYFTHRGKPQVIAQDRFVTAAANLRSIGLVIESMRTIERHGGGAMSDRAFAGFAALPPPRSCWEVLGVDPDANSEEIDRAYRSKALKSHPDRGGSNGAMAELNAARTEALKSEGKANND